MDAAAWAVIRPNLSILAGAADWWQVITGPVDAPAAPEDADFLATASAVAADLDWSVDPWRTLTAALKATTGRSGKSLFLPLRRALTGLDHGPDMAALLPLIGRAETLRRLSA